MGFLFSKPAGSDSAGGKKKLKRRNSDIGEQDRAILELKRQRDRLQKYTQQLEGVIVRETEMARELLRAKKKDRAMLALRKKKYQETMLRKTEGQMLNLEEMVNSIEFASMQSEVFKALRSGTDALDAINKEMSIEDVEQLMDDTAEAIAYQEEISQALAGELTVEDDEDVMRQLEAIEAEQEHKEEPVAKATASVEKPAAAELDLPDVPVTQLGHAAAQRDAELDQEAAVAQKKNQKAQVLA